MHHLYALGIAYASTPLISTPILTARSITVLWSSWCDNLTLTNQDNPQECVLHYAGTALTSHQKAHFSTASNALRCGASGMLWGARVAFFGSAMHDGLRGYVVDGREVVLFASDVEREAGADEVQTYMLGGEEEGVVTDIKVLSDGEVLIRLKAREAGTESLVRMRDFEHFRARLSSGSVAGGAAVQIPFVSHSSPQCVANATTVSVLDAVRKVWTSTKDPRYPKCLGRWYDGTSDFVAIPYLSESSIMKIASGGYMSAALSSEGELFLWGQACPGSMEELAVLSEDMEGTQPSTGITAEGDQDEFVKCLEVWIEGQEASVYDVAIGYGHILVAAESSGSAGEKKRSLFVAGDNSRNQLGLGAQGDFFKDFEEVVALRGKQVTQLAAAGWSSFIVTLG
ncbi:hypothetical protein BDW02DRAFT_573959 [Decorospora gaudefroyi]|uniref:RCC1/BLIP-II n=1 Tax=Decorospora gaudefroyi TaxID=184978 RepID=A0A6A5K552_9PLEO|nr:hypothetical protein BDW02DRAFT_573959 [Decorospora gaudefroyi]